MCGIEKYVANQRRGCCCSLRTFFFLWLLITGAVAFFEIFVGLAFGSFTRMFTDFVGFLGRESARRGLTQTAWGFHVLNLYAQRFTTVLSLLTTVRGCVDLLGLVGGTWGIFRGTSRALALFLAITILNFVVDATIVGTSIYLLTILDLSSYAPTLLILIMVFFGWRLLLGPYVALVIWSLIWIIQAGGNGGEGLSYNEIVQAQEAAKEAAAAEGKPGEAEETTVSEDAEKKALLRQAETKDLP